MNTVSRAGLPRSSAASINARGLHPYPTHAEVPAKASADEMRGIADSITTRIPIAWRRHVCLLIGSGVLAAAQIGKAIISISIIRDDMMLSPAFAGLIVAAFATLGAFFGLGAGIAVRRLDDRRSLSLGMAVITIGSLLGTVAPNEGVLLATRVFEGAGFLAVVLAIPSILARIVPSTERKFVMAVWSAYMPAGIMLMMLFGPLLPMIGWRNLWVATAVLTGGCCLVLAISAPRLPKAPPAESTATFSNDIIRIFCDPTCLMLAFAFFAYASLMFSLAFALPSLLTSTNVALGTASVLSAVVLAMSAIGHVASGFLLRLGVPIWASIAAAFAGFAASALVIYARRFRHRPSPWRLLLGSVSAAWPPARSTQPRRRQRLIQRWSRRRLGCCNRQVTSANSPDPWRWDFGSSISAGMPRQRSWHLQRCLASVPLLPFGKQCGARPHPNRFRKR